MADARRRRGKVSELVAALPGRYTARDRLKYFPTEVARDRLAALSASSEAVETMFGGLCGKVSVIDQTDGLRITFEGGEIVHLRPSGNAPKLRCYNEADSPERVQALNRACLERLAAWR